MFATPVAPLSGAMLTVRFPAVPPRTMSPSCTRDGLDEVAVTVRLVAVVSVSLIVNGIAGVVVLTRMVRLVMAEMTGRRFTVAVNVRVTMLLLVPPSSTVIVTVAEPDALATGVNESEPVAFGLV